MFSKLVRSFKRLLSANSANNSFQISAVGVSTAAIPSGVANEAIAGAQSAVFHFLGEGANDTTYDYRIYTRTQVLEADGSTATGKYIYEYLGGGTATLSTHTQVNTAGDTERYADTITWIPSSAATTPSGSYAAFCNARAEDSGTKHSPADNTPASLLLTSLNNGDDLIVDTDLTGATKANVQIRLSRV